MTLHTIVHLSGPIEIEPAFDLALRSILTAADEMHRYAAAVIERDPEWMRGYAERYIGTQVGQGLPGITDAEALADGALFQPDQPEEGEEPWGDRTPWRVSVSWDTAYGYSGKTWNSASTLHGAALTVLHGALPEGVTMRWQNEFTSEWSDALDGLDEFMGEGVRADAFARLATALVVAEHSTAAAQDQRQEKP